MALDVFRFFEGRLELVGSFTKQASSMSFAYDKEYLRTMTADQLSLSLPLRDDPFTPSEYQGFFEGMVPEGRTRTELARRIGVSPSDYLGLLEHLNCECIGALAFKKQGTSFESYPPEYLLYSDEDFSSLLDAPIGEAAGSALRSRLSIAGAQAKVGLYRRDDEQKWYVPLGMASSTHIVKVPDRELANLPINEYLCMQTAKACRIDAADTLIIGTDRLALTSRRFDRPFSPDSMSTAQGLPLPERLHQEDFCQAAGLPAYRKYEIEETDDYALLAAKLIERISSDATRDKYAFARQTIFNYLIGNCDNHIKNHSFVYSSDWKARRLAPAYDIVSTTVLGYARDMGISIGETRHIDAITAEGWKLFAQDLRMPVEDVIEMLAELRELVPSVLSETARSIDRSEALDIAQAIFEDMEPRLKAE